MELKFYNVFGINLHSRAWVRFGMFKTKELAQREITRCLETFKASKGYNYRFVCEHSNFDAEPSRKALEA